jgi:hypothetical protein
MEAYSQLAASSSIESLTCSDVTWDRVLNRPHGVPVSCCLSATGIRFSGHPVPPGSWAFLTVGLPDHDRSGP